MEREKTVKKRAAVTKALCKFFYCINQHVFRPAKAAQIFIIWFFLVDLYIIIEQEGTNNKLMEIFIKILYFFDIKSLISSQTFTFSILFIANLVFTAFVCIDVVWAILILKGNKAIAENTKHFIIVGGVFWIAKLFYWVLFIPKLKIDIIALFLPENIKQIEGISSQSMGAIQIFALIDIIINLLIAFGSIFVVLQPQHVKASLKWDKFAKSTALPELFLIIMKIIWNFGQYIFPNQGSGFQIAMWISHIIFFILFQIYLLLSLPYYSRKTTFLLAIICTAIYQIAAVGLVFGIIKIIVSSDIEKMTLYLYIAFLPLPILCKTVQGLLAKQTQNNKIDSFISNNQQLKNVQESKAVNNSVLNLKYLKLFQKKKSADFYQIRKQDRGAIEKKWENLWACMQHHLEFCISSQCPLKKTMRNLGLVEGDSIIVKNKLTKEIFIQLLIVFFNLNCKHYVKGFSIKITSALFFAEFTQKIERAFDLLRSAEVWKGSVFFGNYQFCQANCMIKTFLSEKIKGAKRISNEKIKGQFDYERNVEIFLDLMKTAVQHCTDFWGELMRATPKMRLVFKSGSDFESKIEQIDKQYQQIDELIRSNNYMRFDYQVHYQQFLSKIDMKTEFAGKLLKKITQQQALKKKIALKKSEDKNLIDEKQLYAGKAVALLFGGETTNFGQILAVSNNIFKLFGIHKAFALQKSVTSLFQEDIANDFESLIKYHFQKADDFNKTSMFSKSIILHLFGKNAEGQLLPVAMGIQLGINERYGLHQVSIIRAIKTTKFFVLTNNKALIRGIGQGIDFLSKALLGSRVHSNVSFDNTAKSGSKSINTNQALKLLMDYTIQQMFPTLENEKQFLVQEFNNVKELLFDEGKESEWKNDGFFQLAENSMPDEIKSTQKYCVKDILMASKAEKEDEFNFNTLHAFIFWKNEQEDEDEANNMKKQENELEGKEKEIKLSFNISNFNAKDGKANELQPPKISIDDTPRKINPKSLDLSFDSLDNSGKISQKILDDISLYEFDETEGKPENLIIDTKQLKSENILEMHTNYNKPLEKKQIEKESEINFFSSFPKKQPIMIEIKKPAMPESVVNQEQAEIDKLNHKPDNSKPEEKKKEEKDEIKEKMAPKVWSKRQTMPNLSKMAASISSAKQHAKLKKSAMPALLEKDKKESVSSKSEKYSGNKMAASSIQSENTSQGDISAHQRAKRSAIRGIIFNSKPGSDIMLVLTILVIWIICLVGFGIVLMQLDGIFNTKLESNIKSITELNDQNEVMIGLAIKSRNIYCLMTGLAANNRHGIANYEKFLIDDFSWDIENLYLKIKSQEALLLENSGNMLIESSRNHIFENWNLEKSDFVKEFLPYLTINLLVAENFKQIKKLMVTNRDRFVELSKSLYLTLIGKYNFGFLHRNLLNQILEESEQNLEEIPIQLSNAFQTAQTAELQVYIALLVFDVIVASFLIVLLTRLNKKKVQLASTLSSIQNDDIVQILMKVEALPSYFENPEQECKSVLNTVIGDKAKKGQKSKTASQSLSSPNMLATSKKATALLANVAQSKKTGRIKNTDTHNLQIPFFIFILIVLLPVIPQLIIRIYDFVYINAILESQNKSDEIATIISHQYKSIVFYQAFLENILKGANEIVLLKQKPIEIELKNYLDFNVIEEIKNVLIQNSTMLADLTFRNFCVEITNSTLKEICIENHELFENGLFYMIKTLKGMENDFSYHWEYKGNKAEILDSDDFLKFERTFPVYLDIMNSLIMTISDNQLIEFNSENMKDKWLWPLKIVIEAILFVGLWALFLLYLISMRNKDKRILSIIPFSVLSSNKLILIFLQEFADEESIKFLK